MMIFKTVAFTGHRPTVFDPHYDENSELIKWVKLSLVSTIRKCVTSCESDTFLSGGALGVDQWAAEIVLWLRENKFPHIKLTILKPFPEQASNWPKKSQIRFKNICDNADEVINCQPSPFAAWKMQYRNKELVKQSDLLIAVWNGNKEKSGTGNCVKYALSQKRNIFLIDPIDKSLKWLYKRG